MINEKLRLDSHILLMDVGGMPFEELRDAIELFGSEVLPKLDRTKTQAIASAE